MNFLAHGVRFFCWPIIASDHKVRQLDRGRCGTQISEILTDSTYSVEDSDTCMTVGRSLTHLVQLPQNAYEIRLINTKVKDATTMSKEYYILG